MVSAYNEPLEFPGEGREWLSAESSAAEVLRGVIFGEMA